MRIIVIGNAAVDEALAVTAWPTPGTSVLATAGSRDLGGKGANQAIMLARCGMDVDLLTSVGRDEHGDWIFASLAEEGIGVTGCRRCDGLSDRSVILVNPDGENAIVTTTTCAEQIDRDDVDGAIARGADALLLQGNLPLDLTRRALEGARAKGLRTAFNPSPVRDGFADLLPLVDLLIVNAHEAEAMSGVGTPTDAADELVATGAGTVVATLGADGAIARGRGLALAVPADAATVRDTTGAGDTFAGVLVAGWLERGTIVAADLAVAASAAALTVSRKGTRAAFPTRAELAALRAP